MMSDQKRKIAETDPDYEDVADQQTKRQRVLEQDAREAACKKITSTIKREFQREISDKEKELQQIDFNLNQARLMMDRLRACVVASYYGRANRTLSSIPSSSNCSSLKVPPPNIHPAVKKHIGKAPKNLGLSNPLSQELDSQKTEGVSGEDQTTNRELPVTRNPEPILPGPAPPPSPKPFTSLRVSKPHQPPKDCAKYDDRKSRFKIKKKIVIGNVSRYIPVDQRESIDMSSHKWMVYVRGHKSEPDISGFVKKVWFFLHHSYKPNDHVEISSPPFHLTRRGWGEFPVRVQLHFVDARNKKVDIIHHLKLDKTFTGLQKLGAETVVEVELERDFFESDDADNIPLLSALPNGPHLFSQNLSSSSSSSSFSLPRTGSPLTLSKSESSSSHIPPLSSKLENSEILMSGQRKSSPKRSSCELKELLEDVTQSSVISKEDEKVVAGMHGKGTKVEKVKHMTTSQQLMDSSFVKDELEGDGSGVEAMPREIGVNGESKVTEFMEGIDNLDVLGTVDEDFNVTIQHEELLDQGKKEMMDLQNFVEVEEGSSQLQDQEIVSMSTFNEVYMDQGKGNSHHTKSLDDESMQRVNSGTNLNQSTKKQILINSSPSSSSPAALALNPTQTQLFTAPTINSPKASNLTSSFTTSQSLATVESRNQPIIKQSGSSVSLLTSAMLEKLKQQKQQTQPQLLQPPLKKISTAIPQTTQHKISPPTSQSFAVRKQFTVIDMSNLHKNKPVIPLNKAMNASPVQSISLQTSTTTTVTFGTVMTTKNTIHTKLSTRSNSERLMLSPSIDSSSINNLHPGQILTSNDVAQNSVTTPSYKVIHQHKVPSECLSPAQVSTPSSQSKVSLMQSNSNAKKIIYLNPSIPSSSSSSSTSSAATPASAPQIMIPSSSSSVISANVLPPGTKNKKQISLLTGLVVNANKNQSANQVSGTQSIQQSQIIPNNVISVSMPHEKSSSIENYAQGGATTSNPSSISNKPGNSRCIVNVSDNNHQVIVSRTNNPNSLINQMLPTTMTSNISLLTSPAVSKSTLLSSKVEKTNITSNTVLAKTSSPNIVIAYPNPDHISSNSPFLSTDCVEVKMSAIGKTKHRNYMQQPYLSLDPEQERIRKQYEVLNTYKRNLYDYKMPTGRMYNDIIEGEVQIIPKLNVGDYPDVSSLIKAAIRLHPLIETGVNKLTHPYCAESRDQWSSWSIGKQRASEWHRACFTLKYLKECLGGKTAFKGETLFTTRQLVQWCRLHAYSPQAPVLPKPEPVIKDEMATTACTDYKDMACYHNEIPQSFTNLASLKSQLSGITQSESSVSNMDDVEIVLEEYVVKDKVDVKEEMLDDEESSQSELFPLSDGALFVHDWMRKRGVKLLTDKNVEEERIAADVLFQVMMEFGSDILRKSYSVFSQKNGTPDSLSVHDVHSALCSLPLASFCRNAYLGKEEDESGGSSASR